MKNKKTNAKGISIEVNIPDKVSAELDGGVLKVSGPKGETKKDFSNKGIKIEQKDGCIALRASKMDKVSKKLVKSYAAHIRNMINGALEGYRYVLKVCSGHFPMNVSVTNNQLVVKNFFGEKVPRVLKLKPGATVKVEGDKIVVESPSKEIAGQVSADIEQLTRRTRYDSRIFQDGLWVISKGNREIE